MSMVMGNGIRGAATAYGRANNSDPFAAGRMLTHLRNGIEDSSARVADEAHKVMDLRGKFIEKHGPNLRVTAR